MNKKKLLITGSTGLLGSNFLKLCKKQNKYQLLHPNRKQLNLENKNQVSKYFKKYKPDLVVNLSAYVGGIIANINDPINFVYKNLLIQNNILQSCFKFKIDKLVFPGSTCIYPRNARQPIKENYLMTGELEKSNEGYSLTKILGLKLASYYNNYSKMNIVCPMLCNVYGTNDHYDLEKSHVVSSLIKKICDAKINNKKKINMYGSGVAIREFIHVSDAARGIMFFLENVNTSSHINLGTGSKISVKQLANKIKFITKFNGKLIWEEKSFKDGTPKKYSDISKIKKLGFKAKISLDQGLKKTIKEYERVLNKN